MAEYKRRALELRDLMSELDPARQGVSTVLRRRASGHSRDRVMSSLCWLLLHGAVKRTPDALWVRIPDDSQPVDAAVPMDTTDLGLDSSYELEDLLSSLQ